MSTSSILKDRVAIVTAGGSGIGKAGAELLAKEGAVVIVADRDKDAGEKAAQGIVANGGRAEAITTDVSKVDQLDALVSAVVKKYGRIDILHSHAGVQFEGTLEEVDPSKLDVSFQINVRAHFSLARLVVPHMKANKGGSIIITASNCGVLIDAGMIAYTTTKHAIIAMAKQIARDYGKFNIRVNALCPGWVDTPFNDAFTRQLGGREQLLKFVAEQVPMGRFATVDEIAESILFLASDRSSFMTGQAFVIDGGEALK